MILAIILLIIFSTILLLGLFNRFLPEWFCDKMGWHFEPYHQGFDGCNLTGKCPRCGKPVLMDSQGNWF